MDKTPAGVPDLVDCHSHTAYSDGADSVEDNVSAAEAAGCRLLACTDHLTRAPWMDVTIAPDQVDAYLADIEAARLAHPDIEVVAGFECDWYEGCERDLAPLVGRVPFTLGSVHYLGEFAIDWDQDLRLWDELDNDEVWSRYVDAWCKACFCPLNFSSMAHPDLIKLMGSGSRAPRKPLEPLWDRMADAAHEAGVHVEVNTAGLRKDLGECYSGPALLGRFSKAGVPITVGSDAHRSRDVAADIREAYRAAYDAGYRSVDAPSPDGEGWLAVAI
jgi:histidinol-phosphatase (PHP family)